MDKQILDKAKNWAKAFGCKRLFYAGEGNGNTFFNGRSRMDGGYIGGGVAFYVDSNCEVHQIGDARRFEIYARASAQNRHYDLGFLKRVNKQTINSQDFRILQSYPTFQLLHYPG